MTQVSLFRTNTFTNQYQIYGQLYFYSKSESTLPRNQNQFESLQDNYKDILQCLRTWNERRFCPSYCVRVEGKPMSDSLEVLLSQSTVEYVPTLTPCKVLMQLLTVFYLIFSWIQNNYSTNSNIEKTASTLITPNFCMKAVMLIAYRLKMYSLNSFLKMTGTMVSISWIITWGERIRRLNQEERKLVSFITLPGH